ncbi:MAG: flavodoxin, partial [Spirochaetia bacterium]|nr:flavodoxin [Spirochaetia bacterium]
MRKILIVCCLLMCAGSLFADSLVLYFSRSDENYGVGYIEKGNAAIVAEMIAAKTGSDMFQIVPEKAYPAEYKKCTDIALTEKNNKARPA